MKISTQNTIILNQLETELNEIKRQKRNDLNFYDFSKYEYYENKILELTKKIKEVQNNQEVKMSLKDKEVKIDKIHYKDIDLSKRDFEIINSKKVYKPLHVFIYEKDILDMLNDMYKFYSKRRHDLYLLHKGNKTELDKDKEYIQICEHKMTTSRLKSTVNFGSYKNFIIKFDKGARPSREDFTEILFYLSIDGYIPHRDTLEII